MCPLTCGNAEIVAVVAQLMYVLMVCARKGEQ